MDGTGTSAEFYGLEGLAASPVGSILWVADWQRRQRNPPSIESAASRFLRKDSKHLARYTNVI